MKVRNLEQLKVGDTIVIKSEPTYWSSCINTECPFHGAVVFPHVLTIERIEPRATYTAMTCGSYGWNLDSIIDAGCELLEEDCFEEIEL